MGRMVRKQLNIDEDLDAALSVAAQQRGVSQSQVVREALAAWVAAEQDSGRERNEAWSRIEATLEAIVAQGPLPGGPFERTWKREDAYAERLDHLVRRRHQRPDLRP
jgi:predicted transcriptional regulator